MPRKILLNLSIYNIPFHITQGEQEADEDSEAPETAYNKTLEPEDQTTDQDQHDTQERLRQEQKEAEERARKEQEEKLRKEQEEQERLRKEQEEQERLRKEKEEQERLRKEQEEQERLRHEQELAQNKVFEFFPSMIFFAAKPQKKQV